MSTAKIGYPSNESNLLKITCLEIDSLSPYANTRQIGMVIEVSGYDVEQVLCCLIEEYGKEKLIKMINTL